ncbi:tRNA epoxyqueuosine(34) reductase QueG [Nannocystis bainbridge]|uniref:tRNA epoxyqueuosine(34) reductase QueG n=1 Tax=Nannocystis bainbridge TaxID=2995303 RepID=A0ABT5DX40_9BACT|nr:tRNA epoxyqueuosine(34) reductase QueG [Nannocystis bainbridge]MDC0718193.1 tRNA epoxyqueuosine(34) reductase QueG [Nannocystis bainbridge]
MPPVPKDRDSLDLSATSHAPKGLASDPPGSAQPVPEDTSLAPAVSPVPEDTSLTLTPAILARLAAVAEASGLLKLGVVRLDHPGFVPARAALDAYVAAGKAGDMDFIPRTLDLRKDPSGMLPGARTMLVAAVPYGGEPGPIARYARTVDYHTVVHQRLIALEAALHAELPGVRSLICVDTKPVLERSAAALAGLGFIGKHGCLIVPGLGSYVLLGELLCTADWSEPPPSAPPRGVPWDACGACTRCLDACPTAAFDAPGQLDPRRCLSYLTIEHRGPVPEDMSEKFGERLAGCDVCQEVCPYNAGLGRNARIPTVAWLPPAPRPAPTVTAMAALGGAQYRGFVRHTALRRIPHRLMRRNALLALGNRTGAPDPDERHAFAAGLLEPDSRVHDAARWAAARRGLDEQALTPELEQIRREREAAAAAALAAAEAREQEDD